VISPFATINIKLHVPMTLDLKPSNFTKWSTAFQAMCGKFGLLHHLATASTPRPTDEVWTQADFCVRSWMYSTVSDAVLNLAMTDNTQTASALWTAIGGVFQANKAPRAIFLNHEFHSPTQGDLSIDAYCVRMKEKADELRDVGQPVYESNLVLNLLRGLIEAYSASPITSPDSSPSPSPPRAISSSDEKTHAATALLAAASSQQQQQGGRHPNTKKGAQQPFFNSPTPTYPFPGASIPGPANVWPLESVSPLLDSAAREVLAPLKVPVPRLGATRASSGLPRWPTPPSLHYRCPPVAPPPPPTPGMQPASLLPCSTCNCRATRPG
jgi:hypothetical protein